MKRYIWFVIILVLIALPGSATNPFGGRDVDLTQTDNEETGLRTGVPAGVPEGALSEVGISNKHSGAFPAKALSQPIVRARIVFKDETSKYRRVTWIEQTFQAHGAAILRRNNREGSKGGVFGIGKTKWMDANYEIEAREFVAQMLCSHYGGTVGQKVSDESVSPLPGIDGVLEIDRTNLGVERRILQLRLEYDTQIKKHDGSGLLSRDRREDDARMKAILQEINGLMDSYRRNMAQADKIILDKALEFQKNKDYLTALAFYNLHGIKDTNTRWYAGLCHKELGQYEQAIDLLRRINSNQARLEIAEIRLLQGDKNACANELMGILANYRNSDDQQKALARFDDWKLLEGNNELSGKVSAVYLTKAFQLQQAKNTAQAANDYKRACELRTGDGQSVAAVSRAIVAEYSKTLDDRKREYNQASSIAEQRFYRERDEAMRRLNQAEDDLRRVRRSAELDYEEELSRLSYEIRATQINAPVTPNLLDSQTRLDRLVEQERWLRYNQDRYVNDRILSQRRAFADAEQISLNYNLNRKDSYIASDVSVSSSTDAYRKAQNNLTQVQEMAKNAY